MKEKLNNILPIILFGLWPFIGFLNHNQDDALIYGMRVLSYAIVYTGLLLLLALVLNLFFKKDRTRQIAATLATGTVMFFLYIEFSHLFSSWGITLGRQRLVLWMTICILFMLFSWFISRQPLVSKVINVMGFVLVVIPLLELSLFVLQTEKSTLQTTTKSQQTAYGSPNVYWFILDMYTREDILKRHFNYNNSDFVSTLKEQGFFVASRAVANYASTKLSISSTLNMDYYLPVGKKLHPSLWNERLQGFNNTVTRFKSLGYDYIHAEPGGNTLKTRCGGLEDKCITARPHGAISISEAEVGLFKLTPLFPLIRVLAPDLFSFDFTSLEDIMVKIDASSRRPFFLFAHIISPHPPARYAKDCSMLSKTQWTLIGDTPKTDLQHYMSDLSCLNGSMLRIVKQILQTDKNEPIIIIQGDHGIRIDLKSIYASLSDEQAWTFTWPILHAMRLPSTCSQYQEHSFSPINSFRIVFNCINGENLPLLQTKVFRHKSFVLHEVNPALPEIILSEMQPLFTIDEL